MVNVLLPSYFLSRIHTILTTRDLLTMRCTFEWLWRMSEGNIYREKGERETTLVNWICFAPPTRRSDDGVDDDSFIYNWLVICRCLCSWSWRRCRRPMRRRSIWIWCAFSVWKISHQSAHARLTPEHTEADFARAQSNTPAPLFVRVIEDRNAKCKTPYDNKESYPISQYITPIFHMSSRNSATTLTTSGGSAASCMMTEAALKSFKDFKDFENKNDYHHRALSSSTYLSRAMECV